MEFFVIGIGAGMLAGLFGIGGGVVIVPALVMISRLSPVNAVGTSLAALLLPVGALGAWEYYRAGHVRPMPALFVAGGLMLGTWLGAQVGLKLPEKDLQRAFAVFLVFVAGHMWWSAR